MTSQAELLELLAEADRVSQVLPADARAHRNSTTVAKASSRTQIPQIFTDSSPAGR